ncbi:tyrosine-type recombinase/integrase [Liquorilactobacillus capillatus]|uniref:Integrase family protein n=1 Tax=Liquorilactobacillus capillatus DSM 19910 TaxID=1423731 RepID=A0A0R1M386_9LACO|nr:tyrosine-type recombinase/integrase [Liquorilactobacillus capillatus]KRL02492.1 integrase family protein [Liquorilactobacillus capillatus DSM 19910]
MARIIKVSKGNYAARISWRENGKLRQKYKSGFRLQRDATKFATDFENKINQGIAVTKNIPFSDYFDEWYKTYKQPKITNVTLSRYKIISKVIKKYFKNTKLGSITRPTYQKFITFYGSNHAKDTVQKLNSIVRACVRSAIFDNLLAKDFTQNVELSWNKDKQVKVEYLSIAEINKLVSALKSGRQKHFTSRYMILTAIYTGMRLGEIMALTWNDINFTWKTIDINKAWDYTNGGGFKETKNDSSKRIIKVNDSLLDLLKELKSDSKMVFENQYKTIPSSSAVNKTLRQIMKQSGIQKKGFHFHSLRHSHVAYLLANNVDLYLISKRLGHSDMSTTSKVYAYLIEEHKAKLDQQIENSLDKIDQKNKPAAKASNLMQ